MIKNLAIAMFIIIVTSITLNLNEICDCSQLIQAYDCNNYSCDWEDESQLCKDRMCSDIMLPEFCLQQSQRCYWANDFCHKFTNCSSLKGSSQSSCLNQNIYCPASDGTNCQSIEYLQTCTSINTSDNCNNYFSAAGLCMWNGQGCILATSCSQLQGNSTTSCNFSGCVMNIESYQCQPKLCSQFLNSQQCSQGILTFGPYLNNVIACFWNQESNECQEFSPQQVNYEQCYYSSIETYHWDNRNKNKGECVPCFQQLLVLSIIITILF